MAREKNDSIGERKIPTCPTSREAANSARGYFSKVLFFFPRSGKKNKTFGGPADFDKVEQVIFE